MPMPPQDPQAELDLLSRLKRGEEAAFVALYRRHRDAVYRFALLYCGSSAAAADVTQDTFIHLMSRHDQFDPARGSVGPWLCGIARNLARKLAGVREDATDPTDLADESTLDDARIEHDGPLDRILRNEAAEHLRRAIAAIPPHYRDVLILCDLGDHSYAEAAQACGIDIGTVRSRLFRARAHLAQRLAPYASAAKEAS
jgi:RNA polymerase sigma-70 factor (ECF subfamily)